MAKAIAFLVLLLISPAVYAATEHTVGGASGWTTGAGVDYGGWASGQNFAVGDTLLFNYDGTHAVYEVNQDEFNKCSDGRDDDDNPVNVFSSSPTSILLSTPGTRYFICPRSNHCAQGLKLAVTISGGTTTPAGTAPPPTTTPSPTPVTPATPATPATPVTPATPATPATPVTPATPATPATPVTPYPPTGVARNGTAHVVGGTKGWTTGFNYISWASGQNFTTGDTLVFNYDAGTHGVYEVNQNDYNSCNNGDDDDDDDDDDHKPIHEYTSSPTIIPLSTVGTRYFICPRSNNCLQGQKLAVTVVMAGNTTRGGTPPTSGSGTNGATISPTNPGSPPAPAPMSPPPPPSGGAASIMGGRSGLVGGFSFASVIALVGFMG